MEREGGTRRDVPKANVVGRPVLKLKENRKAKEVYAEGLREVAVETAEEARRELRFGQTNRSMAQTGVNENSSRSHTVFSVKLTQRARVEGTGSRVRVTTSKLAIVDLAGNERASRIGNVEERLTEACQINKSLMNLGHCLEEMRRNQRIDAAGGTARVDAGGTGKARAPTGRGLGERDLNSSQNATPSGRIARGAGKRTESVSSRLVGIREKRVVPFRDSKLTHLFQPQLANGSAVMIVNIAPGTRDADETIHSLKRAAVAREVTTAAVCNRARALGAGSAASASGGGISPSVVSRMEATFSTRETADKERIAELEAANLEMKGRQMKLRGDLDGLMQALSLSEGDLDECQRRNEVLSSRLEEKDTILKEKEALHSVRLVNMREEFELEAVKLLEESIALHDAEMDVEKENVRRDNDARLEEQKAFYVARIREIRADVVEEAKGLARGRAAMGEQVEAMQVMLDHPRDAEHAARVTLGAKLKGAGASVGAGTREDGLLVSGLGVSPLGRLQSRYIPENDKDEIGEICGPQIAAAVETWEELAGRSAAFDPTSACGSLDDTQSLPFCPIFPAGNYLNCDSVCPAFSAKIKSTAMYIVFIEEQIDDPCSWCIRRVKQRLRPLYNKPDNEYPMARAVVGAILMTELCFANDLFPHYGSVSFVESYSVILRNVMETLKRVFGSSVAPVLFRGEPVWHGELAFLAVLYSDAGSACDEGEDASCRFFASLLVEFAPLTLLCRRDRVEVPELSREDAFMFAIALASVDGTIARKPLNPEFKWSHFRHASKSARKAFRLFSKPQGILNDRLAYQLFSQSMSGILDALDSIVSLQAPIGD